ncbi:MAG: transcriptional regulator NrdR [Phycisphaerales bacterium]
MTRPLRVVTIRSFAPRAVRGCDDPPAVAIRSERVICPFCGKNDDKVIDSRASDAGKVVRRRRQCLKCDKRFTTYERVEEASRLMVVKRDGTHVPFSRDNVLKGITAACGKRPVAEADKIRIVDEVEDDLHREFDREVPSKVIGEHVMKKLKEVDDIAYIRFASEHLGFNSAGQIAEEASTLKDRVRDVKDQQKLF